MFYAVSVTVHEVQMKHLASEVKEYCDLCIYLLETCKIVKNPACIYNVHIDLYLN